MSSNRIEEAYIVACGRSAIAKAGKKGALREVHPVDLGGLVLKGILEKLPQLDRQAIEDVIVGCAMPERQQGANIGRLIARRAGLGYEVPGMTLNRFCASSLQAIEFAALKIQAGAADCVVAGGLESMSMPMNPDRSYFSPWILENDRAYYAPMGITAENVAAQYGITREEMDAFAVESHRKASLAQESGKFDPEIIPLQGLDEEGNPITFVKDQGIRKGSNIETLAALKPAFKEDGLVTAATSSQISDGSGFVVLMSRQALEKYGIPPIAKFVGCAFAGCDPKMMGVGPIYAVPKLMQRTGLAIKDMDVIELNEAFAAQAIPCIKELGFDPVKVNPNGGAIALGHPLGGTGAILVCKALSELKRTHGKYALITMCIGGGMGAACIIEAIL
jgi:acetyl-CoA acyltransferase